MYICAGCVCIYIQNSWTCNKLVTLLWVFKTYMISHLWWCIPLITALERQRQRELWRSRLAWSTYWVTGQPQLYYDYCFLRTLTLEVSTLQASNSSSILDLLPIKFLGLRSDLLWHNCLSMCFNSPSDGFRFMSHQEQPTCRSCCFLCLVDWVPSLIWFDFSSPLSYQWPQHKFYPNYSGWSRIVSNLVLAFFFFLNICYV